MICAGLFALAIVHTFSTKYFERLAHRRPAHAGFWHLLGEVEVVFGFWASVMFVVMLAMQGRAAATAYVNSRNFTEPLFVFAIMVISGSLPVLRMAGDLVTQLARLLPSRGASGFYFVVLSVVPLLGSFITEPAAMTLAALMLRDAVFARGVSTRLRYATVGVLFVNVSIGGTLTPFAAPPVLMVAAQWGWDFSHMASQFGWKAALAVLINSTAVALLFRPELAGLVVGVGSASPSARLPAWVSLVHLALLGGVVVFAHDPPVFLGLLMFFLGLAAAYPSYQERLLLREGLLVAFFLAGLVVLGGQQQWWLEPLLMQMSARAVFLGATALTAFTDNAALTYLGSLVEGLSDEFKYALVAGAVSGGGLTVIANAPNPAGYAMLREHFEDGAIHPLGLLAAALAPTAVAMLAFGLL